jgi:hypothetical protein
LIRSISNLYADLKALCNAAFQATYLENHTGCGATGGPFLINALMLGKLYASAMCAQSSD